MIVLDGHATAADLRPEIKQLTEEFDDIEARAFSVLSEDWRKKLAHIRLETFRALNKAEQSREAIC